MNLLESFALGVALGFSLAGPPGPMNALIAAQSARAFRSGVVTGLGAMTSDAILGTLVFTLSRVVDLSAYLRPIDAVGAGMLVFLAVRTLRDRGVTGVRGTGDVRTFSQGVGIGLTNPFQVAWWLTAGLAFAGLGGPLLFVGLFGAIAVWVVAFPYAVHAGTQRYPAARVGITYVSVGILFAFAAYFAYLAV